VIFVYAGQPWPSKKIQVQETFEHSPMADESFSSNPRIKLSDLKHDLKNRWIKKNTAILVIHGIGDQNPVETIDQFGSELIRTLDKSAGLKFTVSHLLAKKDQSGGLGHWFDNFIRIQEVTTKGEATGPHLDLYEYYWAHFSEEQMDLTDIAGWVSNVTKGANRFYTDNRTLGLRAGDDSMFFKNGRFIRWKYKAFVYFCCAFFPSLGFFTTYFLKWFSHIPIVGILFRELFNKFIDSKLKHLTNIIGDITVYNVTDQKCKFYKVRQDILAGAVKALTYLLEPDEEGKHRYEKVLLAGHSLGSQVAYDAVNRLVHLLSQGEVKGYNVDGQATAGPHMRDIFAGFVTFGSPLDKIAFFLREHVPHEQFIREQMLMNFHCFKQRNWNTAGAPYEYVVQPVFHRLLDGMKWKNYFDSRDYVSGSLDYYHDLTNVECCFPSKRTSFTHGNYWTDRRMFEDIIHDFIL
jgi:hypothetical protein